MKRPPLLVRAYRRLLRVLPREVRDEYGDEMVRLFAELDRDARAAGGRVAAAGHFLGAAARLVGCGLGLWREREDRVRESWSHAGHGSGKGGGERMGVVWQDVRVAVRGLLRRPGFAVTAVVILGTGIGATTAIFSVVDTVVLRGLPYPDAGRLIHFDNGSHSYVSFRAWQDLRAFESVSAATDVQVDLTGEGPPERIPGALVSRDFFEMFGAAPRLGRLFTPDDFPGDRSIAVISEGLYERLGRNPDILSDGLVLDGAPTRIVGVLSGAFLPPEIETGDRVDVWFPLGDGGEFANDHGYHVLGVVGRLDPTVPLEVAQAEVDAQRNAVAEEVPRNYVNRDGSLDMVPLVPIHEATVRGVRATLFLLLGAVGMMLLIACANVANLFMARGTARTREIALRGALGASRSRIAVQVLTESVVLALAGGLLGIGIAYFSLDLYARFAPGDLPRVELLAVDTRVLVFCLAASVGTGLLFGILPALQATRADVGKALKEGARSATASLGGRRVRSGLVVAEIALAMVLLVGAGLLIRSFTAMVDVDPGFDTDGLVVLPLALEGEYDESERRLFTDELRSRLEALPGTQGVAMGWTVPFTHTGGSRCCWRTTVTGDPALVDEDRPFASIVHPVSAGYFTVLGAPFVSGRDFTTADEGAGAAVAVLNRPAAEALFGSVDVVGRAIDLRTGPVEVIGVVEGVNHWGLNQAVEPGVYLQYREHGFEFGRVQTLIRTDAPLETLAEAVRAAVWEIDPTLPIQPIQTMEARVAASLTSERFLSGLLTVFAAVALILACGGIYGSMLYTVGQRRREMGIRLALGAGGGDVLGLVLRYGVVLALTGVALGWGSAWLLSRYMEHVVWGITATDPPTFLGTAGILALTAVGAALLPAWRASRTDPLETLRAE